MKCNLLVTQFIVTVAHDWNTENENENRGKKKKEKKKKVEKEGRNM